MFLTFPDQSQTFIQAILLLVYVPFFDVFDIVEDMTF